MSNRGVFQVPSPRSRFPEPITPVAVETQHKHVRDTGLGFLEYDSSSDEEPLSGEGNNMSLFNEIEDSSGSESSSGYSQETVLPDRARHVRSASITSSSTSGEFLDALNELPEDQDEEEVKTAEMKGPFLGLGEAKKLALSLAEQFAASKQQRPSNAGSEKRSALAEYTAVDGATYHIAEGPRYDSHVPAEHRYIERQEPYEPDGSVNSGIGPSLYDGREDVDQDVGRDELNEEERPAIIVSGKTTAKTFVSESEGHGTAALKESPPIYAGNSASIDPGNCDMKFLAEGQEPADVFKPEANATAQRDSGSPDMGLQNSAQGAIHEQHAVDVTALECVKESENIEDGMDDDRPELAGSAHDEKPVTGTYKPGGLDLHDENQPANDTVEVTLNDETQTADRSREQQPDALADLSARENTLNNKTNMKESLKPPQDPKEQQTKLTATNVEALKQDPKLTPGSLQQKKREPIPKINVNQYMDDAWEAASSVATSVMTERTTSLIRKASLNRWFDKDHRLLEHFCAQGKSQAVRALLAQGCNPGRPRRPRKGPIMSATKGASEKHNKCVRALIESGVDVNVTAAYHGKTPLHYAIENPNFKGYAKLIRELIEAGAETNRADLAGNYPLLKIFYGNETGPLEAHRRDALALLLRREEPATLVDIAQPGTLNTPLHLAARRKDVLAVGLLLHRKADVNAKNASGLTPLLVTTKQLRRPLAPDHISLIDLLLSTNGIKVDEKAGVDQQTALHQAVKAGIWEVVEQLLQHGADPCCTDKAGQDAFSLARRHEKEHTEEDHIHVMDALNEALSNPWPVASET
ncbi:uncharacterized protein N0V89_007824 [Didymosphaeria variabile]|uniref:Ankyrin n=1 Tax=Didymosphaeria variabile TaxID=1932322 RepID=A0A9W8XLK9_9PLEO|nr:uncharacterized protein N0V89_007824 [Didymosphaeria variabile]KAJ4352476.1 hypothetical protein N0V89_007824 [Didymosphaeria variabile]